MLHLYLLVKTHIYSCIVVWFRVANMSNLSSRVTNVYHVDLPRTPVDLCCTCVGILLTYAGTRLVFTILRFLLGKENCKVIHVFPIVTSWTQEVN